MYIFKKSLKIILFPTFQAKSKSFNYLIFIKNFNSFSAGKVQGILDQDQKKLWSSRSVKDDVVIMGQDDNDSATKILKNIMENV